MQTLLMTWGVTLRTPPCQLDDFKPAISRYRSSAFLSCRLLGRLTPMLGNQAAKTSHRSNRVSMADERRSHWPSIGYHRRRMLWEGAGESVHKQIPKKLIQYWSDGGPPSAATVPHHQTSIGQRVWFTGKLRGGACRTTSQRALMIR